MERDRWRGEGVREPPARPGPPVSSLRGESRPGGGGQEMVGRRECSAGGWPAGGVLLPPLWADLLPRFCCMRQWILNQLDRRPYLDTWGYMGQTVHTNLCRIWIKDRFTTIQHSLARVFMVPGS